MKGSSVLESRALFSSLFLLIEAQGVFFCLSYMSLLHTKTITNSPDKIRMSFLDFLKALT